MADDGVKISALTEVLTEPATGEMVASVVGGVTYKRDIGKRLPSTAQKSALVGYGGTPSGTNPYATQTGATALAATAARPLSDLSRVMRINGDGVPMFPDNVAGTIYGKNGNFTTTNGWTGIGATLSVANGNLIAVSTSTFVAIARVAAYGSNKVIVFRYRGTKDVDIFGTVNGVTDQYLGGQVFSSGGYNEIVTFVPGDLTSIYLANGSVISGDTFEINGVYIGTGAYDTQTYSKDGVAIATNLGAVPVNGPRGKGLLFQGNGKTPLIFNTPIFGSIGTLRFKIKTPGVFSAGYYFGNRTADSGLRLYTTAAGYHVLDINTGAINIAIGTLAVSTEYVISVCLSLTNVYVYINGAFVLSTVLSESLKQSTSNLYIGRDALGTEGIDFHLYDFEYVAEAETLDAHIRFMNGDDAVDSQQKAITNVPNAIKICDSKGNIRQPGLPVYADNTAALAGGLVAGEPYRTSTGILMVVY